MTQLTIEEAPGQEKPLPDYGHYETKSDAMNDIQKGVVKCIGCDFRFTVKERGKCPKCGSDFPIVGGE